MPDVRNPLRDLPREVTVLVTVAFFVAVQRYLIQGLSAGAIKG